MWYRDIGKHWFPSNDNPPVFVYEGFVEKLDKHLSEITHKNSLPRIIDEVVNFCLEEFKVTGIGEILSLPGQFLMKLPNGSYVVVFATDPMFDFSLLFAVTLSGGEPEELLVIHAPEVIKEVDAGVFLREVYPVDVPLDKYIRDFVNRVFLASSSKITSIKLNNKGD